MAEDAPLIHAEWASYEGDEELGRDGNVLGYSTIVKGDAAAAMAGGRRRRQGPLRRRRLAGRPDRAAGDPRANGRATA